MNNIIGVRSQESGVRSQESGVRSQESGVRPLVSFCIPIYNRAEIVRKIAEGILVCDDPRFELILCDNASEENISEAISHIHDPRLRYYRNETNLGSFKNFLKALELGKGEYLYLVMGRDRIAGEHIGRLIEILEYARENNITLLYDGYIDEDKIQVFEGIDAMITFVNTAHPTGTIFNRKQFRLVPDKASHFDAMVQGGNVYPENYLRHALLLKGKGAKIFSGIFKFPAHLIDKTKELSTWGSITKLEDMYYAPARRISAILDFIDIIDSDQPGIFPDEETDKYFSARFDDMLNWVSIRWREKCSIYEHQAHYGQQVRHVTRREMLSNILKAYRETKAHLKAKGRYSRRRHRSMCRNVLKYTIYFPAKNRIRKILELLGIWSFLRFIKHAIKEGTKQS